MTKLDPRKIIQALPKDYYIIDVSNYTIVDSNNPEVELNKVKCFNHLYGFNEYCPEQKLGIECTCDKILNENSHVELEQIVNTAEGLKAYKISANPIKDENGKITHILVQYSDIKKEVELKRELEEQNVELKAQTEEYETANEELLEQKEEYETLYEEFKEANEKIEKAKKETEGLKDFYESINEAVQDGIMVTDKNDVIYYVNPVMEKISGLNRLEFINKHIINDFKETTKNILPYFNKAKESLKPYWYEAEVKLISGESTFQNGWIVPMVKKGKYRGVIFTIRDVSERVNSEKATIESEEKFRLLFENMQEAFALHKIITNNEGKAIDYIFVDVNSKFEELTGLKRDEIKDKRVLEVLPKTEKYWIENYGKVALTGKSIEFENYSRELDKYYRVSAYCPKKEYFATVFKDVTEIKKQNDELIDSREKLNKFIHESQDAQSIVNSRGDIILWNKAHEKLTGYTQKEVLNKKIWDIQHKLLPQQAKKKYSRESVKKLINEILGGKDIPKNVNIEIPIIHKDGSIRYIEQSVFRIDTGKEVLLGNINRDITEKKLMQDALRQNEEKYRRLTENSPDITYIFSLKRGALYWSSRVKDILGLDPNELKRDSRLWTDSIHPDHKQEIEDFFENIKPGKTYELEYRIYDTQGKIHWFYDRIFNVHKQDDDIIIEGIVSDITEEKEAELALARSEEKFRSVLENMKLIGLMLNPKGEIIFINNYLLKLTGWKRNEVIGKDWFNTFLPDKVRKSVGDFFNKTMNKKDMPVTHTNEIITKKGELRLIQWNNTLHFDENKNIISVTSIGEDITENRKAEKAIKESEEKLNEIFNSTSEAIIIHDDKTGKIFDCNDATLKMYGYKTKEEILALSIEHVSAVKEGFDKNKIIKQLEKASQKDSYTFEWLAQKKNGDVFWVEVSLRKTFIAGEGRLLAVVRDITERKKLEQARLESEEKYRSIFENAALGIYRSTPEGKYEEVNEAFANILGFDSPAKMIKEVNDIGKLYKHAEDRERIKKEFAQKGFVKDYIVKANHPKKDTVWISINGKQLKRADGKIYYEGTIQDITERKLAEQELKSIEWLLKPKKKSRKHKVPAYGDLSKLNKNGLILNAVGKETLNNIVNDYLSLLDTSAAVYEKNGDYALGIFSSGWCQFMDASSRNLCNNCDNQEALSSGKWLCHESCWTDTSLKAIRTKKPTDIECNGGIRIYAIPIFANNEVIGAINFGYSNPPLNEDKLKEIAKRNKVSEEKLKQIASDYESRPQFIIDLAKERLETSARLIGEIVERKLAKEALKVSEEKFRTIFDMSLSMICIADINTATFNVVNPAFKQILGYTEEELLSKPFLDFVHPDDQEATVQVIEDELKAGKEVIHFTNRYRCKDNSYRWLEWNSHPIPDGGITYAIAHDITNQKEGEKALRESEEKYRNLFENLIDEVHLWKIIKDKNGKIKTWELVDANPSALKVWGKKRSQVVGKTTNEIFGYEATKLFIPIVEKIFETGKPHTWETYFPPTDQYLSMASIPYGDFFISTGRDVTEIRKAEKELQQSEEKYRSLVENIQEFVFLIDKDYKILSLNQSAKKLLGAKDDYIGKTLKEVFPDYIYKDYKQGLQRVFETSQYLESDTDLEVHGHKLYVHASLSPLKNEKGEVAAVIGLSRDITKRKQAENELIRNEDALQKIIQITGKRKEGNYFSSMVTALNKVFNSEYVYIGTLKEEKEIETIALSKKGKIIENITYGLKDAPCGNVVGKNICVYTSHVQEEFPKDQLLKELEINGYVGIPLINSAGNVIGILVALFKKGIEDEKFVKSICELFAGNISAELERTQAENELRKSEEKFRRILKNAKDMIYRISLPDGKYEFVSDAAAEIAGSSIEDISNSPFIGHDLIHPDWKEYYEAGREDLLQGKLKPYYEYKIIDRKGVEKWLYQRSSLIYGDGDKPIAIEGVVTDISELKKAEEALKESEEKFRRITENAKDMIYRMTLPDGIYEFVSNASTDLFGYSPEEFYENKQLIQKIIHPDWQNYFEVQWKELLKGNMPPTYE